MIRRCVMSYRDYPVHPVQLEVAIISLEIRAGMIVDWVIRDHLAS